MVFWKYSSSVPYCSVGYKGQTLDTDRGSDITTTTTTYCILYMYVCIYIYNMYIIQYIIFEIYMN